MRPELTVIKIGGNVLENPQFYAEFLDGLSSISKPFIIVHGGGKIATEISQNLGIQTQMIAGRRVTSSEDLKVVIMTYAGLINKKLVADLQSKNCSAIGLSGADANLITSTIRSKTPIDFGLVGDVEKVNGEFLQLLLKNGMTPIICSLTHDGKGQLLNTNADTIASEISIEMGQFYTVNLHYCFEKNGVLKDAEIENSLISHVTSKVYHRLIEQNKIHSGMIPKLENSFHALKNGVSTITIRSYSNLNGLNKYTTISL
jgi:acetylglutamate kinase